MAVQAQYPSSNAFSHDIRDRPCNDVFSDYHPQSELTSNTSGSKKRSSMALSHNRLHGTTGATPSGTVSASVTVAPPLVSNQSVDMDAIIRLQTERLQSGLGELRKKHCRDLLSMVDQQAVKRLKGKEMELESVSRRNAELEERVRQMSAETHIWFNVAKNNEALVYSLRSTLEQVLQQSNTIAAVDPPADEEEGYGDSDGGGGAAALSAGDARSCCFEEEDEDGEAAALAVQRENEGLRRRRGCRSCGEREGCVLLLPCRHLCLCKECEPRIDTCPVCHSTRNASLQIIMH